MIGSARRMRSPSRTIRSRSTPWVAGCCGPMLRVMSAVASPAAPMPMVTSRAPGTAVRSVVDVMAASLPYASSSPRRSSPGMSGEPVLERVRRGGGAGRRPGLGEDVAEVTLHGLVTEEQGSGDLGVALAGRDQSKHLDLSGGQPVGQRTVLEPASLLLSRVRPDLGEGPLGHAE